ncbi:TlpA family protein disulfide reductase [bacterium]|nr:MAG: TlpA family protein disulfide reductase [bacterium]
MNKISTFGKSSKTMKIMQYVSTLLLAVLFTVSACAQGQPQLTDAQKTAIQQAKFKTLDGKTVTLADYKGKVVILDFWETWCGPCLKFMPTLDKLANDYVDDFVVLAVSPGWDDSVDDVKAFSKEKGYFFTHVFAPELAKDLRIMGIPYKVYVAADGTVIKAQMGITGNPDVDYAEVEKVIKAYKVSK